MAIRALTESNLERAVLGAAKAGGHYTLKKRKYPINVDRKNLKPVTFNLKPKALYPSTFNR
jgi:hypothetical protein